MPYDYYCTNCGRKITQDEVLFDMQYLLTKNKDKKFNILKFRMRLAELAGLLTGALLLAAGLWLMWTGMGAAVLVASIWLLLSQPENPALGRRKELL